MDDYKFKNLPITPKIVEQLLPELMNGQTLKRDDIVKSVLKYHFENGGLNSNANDFPRSVKKALANMQKKGNVTNRSTGYWSIHKSDEPIINSEVVIVTEPSKINANVIYGDGNFNIYFYYFPTYKILAQLQNSNFWPCKIGRTDRDPILRILSQVSTALPEEPCIDFVVKTEHPSLLEKAIHSILKLKRKHIESSPGSEWFNTNPEEVLGIIRSIDDSLL